MATQPKPTQSMSAFVDSLLMQGITWAKFETRAKEEAVKRGIKDFQSMGALKRHVRHRASQTDRYVVEQDDVGVRMRVVAQPAKAEKPKPKAPPKKTGKAVGKRTKAVVKEQRQQVEPVVVEPAPETPEAA